MSLGGLQLQHACELFSVEALHPGQPLAQRGLKSAPAYSAPNLLTWIPKTWSPNFPKLCTRYHTALDVFHKAYRGCGCTLGFEMSLWGKVESGLIKARVLSSLLQELVCGLFITCVIYCMHEQQRH
eukprot:5144553-Amphidinium_carterae.2